MSSVNRIILVGRLGKDPESRQAGDKKVVSFPLATSEKYNGNEQVEWHNVEIWGKLADIAEQYLTKGSLVFLEGKIKTDQWEKDGVKQYRTKVVVNQMTMLGGNQANGQATEQVEQQAAEQAQEVYPSDDDLPF